MTQGGLSGARTAAVVSVILPCSSAPVDQVRDTLGSIVDQRLATQVLIVGADTPEVKALVGASADASMEVALADTISAAMRVARCDVVGIQSAGDLYLPGAFEVAVDALEREPWAQIAYSAVCAIDDDGALLARQRSSLGFTPSRYLAQMAPVHRSGSLFRRTLIEQARGRCEADDPGGDELWMRMVLAASLVNVGVPLAAVRAPSPEEHRGAHWSAYGRVIHWLDEKGNGSWRTRQAARAGRRLLALDHDEDRPRAARALDVALAVLTHPPAASGAVWPRMAGRRRVRRGPRRAPETGWDLAGIGSYDATLPLPLGAEATLSAGNPRLCELRQRYEGFDSPLCVHSFWADEYRSRDLELRYFRGDNAFVWQYRNMREQTALRYSLYLRHLASIDRYGYLDALTEDGAFGCWAFEFPGFPPVSRDLLDSINEMYFLDRMCGLFDRRGFSVLDIGAGYGRLAHRMSTAIPGLSRYYCTDGVPESTFLSEYYLSFRGVDKAEVVPVDDLERLPSGEIDLAVNIHSFSEMSRDTIAAWLDVLVRLRVPRLLVVPNDPDAFLSYEIDHTRLEFGSILESHGYRLRVREPVIPSRYLRQLIGMRDEFYFFECPEFTA